MKLLALAIAPGFALLMYIYIKDKYEREPLRQVLKAFALGAASAIVILVFWLILKQANIEFTGANNNIMQAFKEAFYGAAIPEETIKFLTFLLFFYKIRDFNEWFDGIVYAVAISLGFATLENIMYVLSQGFSVGITRAIFAVPSHFIDGVTQGFFFSLAKFGTKGRKYANIALALISAIIIHGIYDFLLFIDRKWLLIIFIGYFLLIVFLSRKLISQHLKNSQFKDDI